MAENQQEKQMQLQFLYEQMEQVNNHVQQLLQQQEELEISKNALETLQRTKTETSILAPIANGIFIQAALKNSEKLIVNVGANVTVEKTVPETVALLEEQQKKVIKNTKEAEILLERLQSTAMQMLEGEENVRQTEK